ncbi:helix-turn-helix transcriptional regulator [Pseudoxanthomonas wuyuanensis]|uniref:helix-turn-helix transcriptional regulator n=1 Tax=Pseudoxanthomonas wuyuanensis TaxID=1073196 RepID=UPI001143C4E8|nr:hypothetical protein [Pseudoxanthomonas wuyuanensis]
MSKTPDPGRVLPARVVRNRFGGISAMTLWRWQQAGIITPPLQINGRNYWPEADVDRIIAERAASAPKAA